MIVYSSHIPIPYWVLTYIYIIISSHNFLLPDRRSVSIRQARCQWRHYVQLQEALSRSNLEWWSFYHDSEKRLGLIRARMFVTPVNLFLQFHYISAHSLVEFTRFCFLYLSFWSNLPGFINVLSVLLDYGFDFEIKKLRLRSDICSVKGRVRAIILKLVYRYWSFVPTIIFTLAQ